MALGGEKGRTVGKIQEGALTVRWGSQIRSQMVDLKHRQLYAPAGEQCLNK